MGRALVALRRLLLLSVVTALAPAPAFAQSEIVEYYGMDAVGSVRIVFDASGAVLGRMDYGPFGEALSSEAGMPSRAYAGLFRDGEAGLDYAQARSYQSRTGRFSSVDPVYAGVLEPQRWNRYSYALNNPFGFVDPTGLYPTGYCVEFEDQPGCGDNLAEKPPHLPRDDPGNDPGCNPVPSARLAGCPGPDDGSGEGEAPPGTPPTNPPGPNPTPEGPGPRTPTDSDPAPKKGCWVTDFRFSVDAAHTSLIDLAGLDGGWRSLQNVPFVPRNINRLATTVLGLSGKAADHLRLVTPMQAGKAFLKDRGWYGALSPRGTVISASANVVVSGALGWLAYETGVRAGAVIYATSRKLMGTCQ